MCLVKACEKKAKGVASGVIDALKNRLEDGGPRKMSLMQLLHAMELADPTTTREITQTTWRAAKEIAEKYDIEFNQLKAEILAARKIGIELRAQGKYAACKGNLLRFFRAAYSYDWNPGRVYYLARGYDCIGLASTVANICGVCKGRVLDFSFERDCGIAL